MDKILEEQSRLSAKIDSLFIRLENKLEIVESLLRFLVRQKKSNKLILLEEEVVKKGQIKVSEVENLLGISKTWSLNLMRKLSKQLDFRFLVGDKKFNRPSIVVFAKSQKREGYFKILLSLLEKNKVVTLADVMKKLNLGLDSAKDLTFDFVNENNKHYQIEDGNKIVKKTY